MKEAVEAEATGIANRLEMVKCESARAVISEEHRCTMRFDLTAGAKYGVSMALAAERLPIHEPILNSQVPNKHVAKYLDE